jgi:hypothetical protein
MIVIRPEAGVQGGIALLCVKGSTSKSQKNNPSALSQFRKRISGFILVIHSQLIHQS